MSKWLEFMGSKQNIKLNKVGILGVTRQIITNPSVHETTLQKSDRSQDLLSVQWFPAGEWVLTHLVSFTPNGAYHSIFLNFRLFLASFQFALSWWTHWQRTGWNNLWHPSRITFDHWHSLIGHFMCVGRVGCNTIRWYYIYCRLHGLRGYLYTQHITHVE